MNVEVLIWMYVYIVSGHNYLMQCLALFFFEVNAKIFC